MQSQENRDELEKFRKSLTKDAAAPGLVFQETLKKKVLEEFERDSAWSFKLQVKEFFMSYKLSKFKLAGGLAFALVMFLGLSASGLFWISQNQSPQDGIRKVKAAEKENLLKLVVANNPGGVFAMDADRQVNEESAADAQNLTGVGQTAIAPEIYWDQSDLNYDYYKMVTAVGPAGSRCSLFGSESSSYESFGFYDGAHFYNKSISYDGQGNLTDLYLDNGTGYVEYKGGKFAIKTLYGPEDRLYETGDGKGEVEILSVDENLTQEGSSEPSVDEPTETDPGTAPDAVNGDNDPSADLIDAYFGEDVEVEEVLEDGKVAAYIVTWEYQSSCSEPNLWKTISSRETAAVSQEDEDLETFIRKTWYHPETMEIYQEKEYLGSVSDENLLMTNITTVERKKAEFSDVSSLFVFDYPVTVKIMDEESQESLNRYLSSENNEEYLKKAREYLVLRDSPVLLDQSGKFELSFAEISKPESELESNLYLNRDFYPDGEKGSEMYEEAKRNWGGVIPEFSFSYNSTASLYGKPASENLVINIFDSKYTWDEISEYQYGIGGITPEKVKVKIDGAQVEADAYYLEPQDEPPAIEPARDPQMNYPEQIQEVQEYPDLLTYYVSFTFEGKKYFIYLGVSEGNSLADYLVFKAYDPKKTKDLDLVMGEIEKTLNYESSDLPVSVDGSEGSTEAE